MAPPLPISRSAVDRLGQRLCCDGPISDQDWELLEQVLDAYQEALDSAQVVLEAAGYRPTSRVKSTTTLIEKLRRGTSFKSLQDVAGLRIVVPDGGGRIEQDRIVTGVIRAFANLGSTSRVIDRRTRPNHGYRAVHVVVTHDGLPVEVQIRTPLQDVWAQIVERLGDAWGRALRYGEPVEAADRNVIEGLSGFTRADLLAQVQEASEMIDLLESIQADHEVWSLDDRRDGDAEARDSLHSTQSDQLEASLRSWLSQIARLVDAVEREAR